MMVLDGIGANDGIAALDAVQMLSGFFIHRFYSREETQDLTEKAGKQIAKKCFDTSTLLVLSLVNLQR
jgi:hypothetical protein